MNLKPKSMLVEVRPIPTKKWHEKEGAESFTQPFVSEVLYDPETGAYATGLTEVEQKKYEGLLGVDLSNTFNANQPHPYWSSAPARIKLPNQTTIFNDEKASDFVKIKNLKASKFCANSQKELDEGLWPEALFVIHDESEEIELKASKIQRKNKCVAIAAKMSLEEQSNVIQIMSDKSLHGRSANFLSVELDKQIEENPAEFIRLTKMDKAEVYVRATILEAIHRNILIKESAAIYYMGERLSNDYEECVAWFLDPQNAKMKVTIMEKLTSK